MKLSLLDSNVWAALTIDRHANHREALSWFNMLPDDGSACFCRMTQNSFLRLITSKNIFQEDTHYPAWIRTMTNRVKVCCATITPRGNRGLPVSGAWIRRSRTGRVA